jgi:DNA-binding transcriptional MerR regulator
MREENHGNLAIGEICRRAGCTARTVRFYEEKGLIVCAGRTQGGRKLYGNEAIDRIRFVRVLAQADYSISQIKELIALSQSRRTRGKWVTTRLRDKLGEVVRTVQEGIGELTAARDALSQLLGATGGCTACSAADCDGCGNLANLRTLGTAGNAEETK